MNALRATSSVVISRAARLPDPARVALYRRAPELGPKLLFFSGGSALRELAEVLVDYTHNSVHLITPFDSGGSSAVLRRAFAMPAVGDVRNRIMALADRTVTGNPAVFELFAHRLPKDEPQAVLAARLARLASGEDPLVRRVPDPLRKIIRMHLRFFEAARPADFDLGGASIGNCILTGGYLNYNSKLDPVIYLFMKLVEARGVVRPIVNADLHLACELADGRMVVGQHRITGKEVAPLGAPISRMWLTASLDDPTPVAVSIRNKNVALIESADTICYPYGSFFSSLLANLMPRGVAAAVAATACPKVYIPNLGHDPEQLGLTGAKQAAMLLDTLRAGCDGECPRERLLRFVLVDTAGGRYANRLDIEGLCRLGLEVIDVPLARADNPERFDPRRVAEVLLSLA